MATVEDFKRIITYKKRRLEHLAKPNVWISYTKNMECGELREFKQSCIDDEIIIEALEKQIPKKPIGRHTSYKCPICDRRVRSGKGSSSFGVDHFCQRCGQALDWSEQE